MERLQPIPTDPNRLLSTATDRYRLLSTAIDSHRMEVTPRTFRSFLLLACWVYAFSGLVSVAEDDPRNILCRARNFLVPPSSGPVTTIAVHNSGSQSFEGTVRADFPEGWQVSPGRQPVQLKPGETKRIPFTIEHAVDRAANVYPVSITVEDSSGAQVRNQQVRCASTPYFKPKIDGKLKEWNDAIPITFSTAGQKTVVRSYWNRAQFCLAVEVEEDRLIGLKKSSPESGLDAVQFALAPADSVTGGADGNTSARYEFLVADSGAAFGKDRCFHLSKPGEAIARSRQMRPLQPLQFQEAEVAVKRKGHITIYEVAIPFKSMPSLRPTPGREYCFSLLVHDPDGTGLRDLGETMSLTDQARHPLAWSSWEYVQWKNKVPLDNKIEFGFCSSIH
jgi:hypothetical protein